MTPTREETVTWPDLAIGLCDKLTGRNAEISYQFEDLHIGVPRTAEPDAPRVTWKVDGTVRVRTRDSSSS